MDSIRKRRLSLRNTSPDAAEIGTIRIAVFDVNPLFRTGIVHVLNAEPGMEVVVESGSAPDTLRLGVGRSLDIVVLDSDLITADRSLWSSITGLRPAVKILVTALNPDHELVLETFGAGAQGFILKGVSGHELLQAVRALHRNEGYVSPSLGATLVANASLAGRLKGENANPLAQLTFREGEIFNLIAAGLKNREIGRRLNVSEKTIKRYVTRIFEKLHVRNRVEAAMLSKPGAKPQVIQSGRRLVVALPQVDANRKGGAPPAAGAVAVRAGRPYRRSPSRGNGHWPRD